MAMRVTRRTCWLCPADSASATIGITAQAKPDPNRNSTKNTIPARTCAASAVTSYQPSISASVSEIENCATWLRIKGSPSTAIARMCCVGVIGMLMPWP